ncbi:unnamed protein product (macronuclear) [Paramecium tetraurelia]|uniref:Uncharacterized protein n=1 Tax=Paramecium tetraurelia TaxID=5888 RepID=A0DMM5_PARTE|nr:uncharacterized protein GSPATT00039674001 [Paramecium tetraurelia]CAK84292.1 unnamed protein product [Paramecium tetraurelia]|eukprot:XP_001451689.1 hypothetical protein (macronuclear) [Paramecium tetraurelia strain d4-2]
MSKQPDYQKEGIQQKEIENYDLNKEADLLQIEKVKDADRKRYIVTGRKIAVEHTRNWWDLFDNKMYVICQTRGLPEVVQYGILELGMKVVH